jgi:hypothetical protein
VIPGFSELPVSGIERVNLALQNHAKLFKKPLAKPIFYTLLSALKSRIQHEVMIYWLHRHLFTTIPDLTRIIGIGVV